MIPFSNQKNYLKKVPQGWLLYKWLLLEWLLIGWLLLTFSLCKTPLGETGCLGNPYFLLTACLSIQFFDSPPFLNTVSYSAFGYLPLTVQHLTGRNAMPLVTRCFTTQPLTSSLTLPWAIARFLDPFYTFSPAHCRVICNFTQMPTQGSRGFPCGWQSF